MSDFIPETFLGQILIDGQWVDYARGYELPARNWLKTQEPGTARVVDWIDKGKVLFSN